MPLWKVTERDATIISRVRVIRSDRRSKVESLLLQAYDIERVKSAEEMVALKDVPIEDVA